MFSGSITRKTQGSYATAVTHYLSAEKSLGRPFSVPPSPEEVVFLVAHLLGKELKPVTVRSYLAGIRFYLLSKGVFTPARLPILAEQLLQGKSNLTRNALMAANRKQRRAVTIDILVLLSHSIAQQSWTDYEKSLIWTVSCCAFWGSFRLKEILSEFSGKFNPQSSFLASYLSFNVDGSINFWLCNPKVWSSDTGDVIEVWPVPQSPQLDPILALKAFLSHKKAVFGKAGNLPLFIHSDGEALVHL